MSNLGPVTVRNVIESELWPWDAVEVTARERKVYLADVGGIAQISLYYLPDRDLIVRFVPKQQPGSQWQTLRRCK